MEILIFSDSHGDVDRMRRVIEEHSDATHILFCGDGLDDIHGLEQAFPRRVFASVRGNCDGFSSSYDVPTERLLELCGLRILMMHGHLYGVKGGYGVAAAYAARMGADVLLFGHTHMPYDGRVETSQKTVHLFNPGSIGMRGEYAYYGVLEIRENGYLFSHGQALR